MTRYVAVAAAIVLAAACGGNAATQGGPGQTNGADSGTISQDSGAPVGADGGSDAEAPLDPSYPTQHAAIPQVAYWGGSILASVRVVTITFTGEDPTVQQTMQDFGDQITTSAWWDAVTENGKGYCEKNGSATGPCVGHGTPLQNSNPHVVLSETPAASYTDSSLGGPSTLQTFIQSLVADGELPAPEPDILYAFYFPAVTTITLDGDVSCQSFGAYHGSTQVMPSGAASSTEVAYAIMPRCSPALATNTSGGEALTYVASHEIIEAATDPYIGPSGYSGYGMNDVSWGQPPRGGEVGDLCTSGNYVQGAWTVTRSWSNASAAASHDPCVPIPAGEVYFNVAPDSDVVHMAVGQTKTIDLTAFSDAQTADWTVAISDHASFTGGTQVLTFNLSQTSGYNGAKILLSITMTGAPTGGQEAFSISSRGTTLHQSWPMMVEQQLQ